MNRNFRDYNRMFDDQRNQVLATLDEAHDAYYRAEVFGGPSLYFHLKNLEAARARDFEPFAEYVYAVLASWGMHRMGPGGSKMRDFGEFSFSLKSIWQLGLELQDKSPNNLNEADWSDLKKIFTNLSFMASGTSLVGNSKVMAHLIPNLVPPIDREYTLKFLFGNGQIKNDIEAEWDKLKQILLGFFYPILQSPHFLSKASEWMMHADRFKWDTSLLKIADNLVIGASKIAREK
jgi:hypothetical protein